MTPPRIVHELGELRESVAAARRTGRTIGFVPTMGALHAGHLSLARAATAECGFTAVSVFVNPTQFGPHEDFSRYPRTLEADARLLGSCPVDVIFAPSVETMYPKGFSTTVDVGGVTTRWEGERRPGHFRGVATVVLKLFNMVGPDRAYFGQKDYQQSLLVRRMIGDLNLPIELRVCPTVREADGLALSSRNAYLNADERRRALSLSRGLRIAHEAFVAGERICGVISDRVRQVLTSAGGVEIDYIAIVDPDTLEPVTAVSAETVVLLAARVGSTRLIDNAALGSPWS